MPRNTPCRACKKRRRKCVWETSSTVCSRCSRLNLDCSPFEDSGGEEYDDDELPTIDGSKELDDWFGQVRSLENELNNLEIVLRSASPSVRSMLSFSYSDSDSDRGTTSDGSLNDSSLVMNFSQPVSSTHARLLAHSCQSFDPSWKFSVVNGNLRLETNIRTFGELYQLSQASMRYLSPFSGIFQETSVVFDSSTGHTVTAALRLITRHRFTHARRAAITNLPILSNYKPIIDRLVHLFIEFYNTRIPLLHVPTFSQHYESLKDPLNSPIVLGICVNMVASFRKVPDYSAMEKRQLADFFYRKCHDLLLDMFDDPDRRLETVMTISFLMQYLIVVRLQFVDARRIGTMALMICAEIESTRMFESFSKIEQAMFFRHAYNIDEHMRVINLALDCNTDGDPPRCREMEYLDDESDTVKNNITVLNHISRLTRSHLVVTTLPQVKRIVTGEPGELNLDLIVRFETLIREWWATLPDNIRISEDPYDRNIHEYISKINTETAIMTNAFLHCMTMLIHATLLNPRISEVSASQGDILRLIQQRALEITLRSCDLLLATLARWVDIDMTRQMVPFTAMGHVMYALSSVCIMPKTHIPQRVKTNFFKLFKELSGFLPPDHRVPASISPITAFMTTKDVSALCVYEDYPLPGYAFVLDILDTSYKHIEPQLQK